jgi:hypothetical protein
VALAAAAGPARPLLRLPLNAGRTNPGPGPLDVHPPTRPSDPVTGAINLAADRSDTRVFPRPAEAGFAERSRR